MLSSEVKQDNKYVIMKSLNSDKEYKIVLFSSDSKLLENQKTSLSAIINKFYSEIWSMKKEYSSELWNAVYENILDTL